MTPPAKVTELVERFERNLDVYKRPNYKEARVRVEFVDPFFEALGWDVRNVQGYAEQYKDVVHEDAIKVGGVLRAPDYCFRVGGARKFFLEVKKPAVYIKEDVGPAYQLRRYAWSAKLPLSILTDFEEFAVYDCRRRPKSGDKVSVGRVMYFTFDQYLDHFDELYDVFARESVLKGSFDRYAEHATGKRGTAEVDTEFLKEIEGWRDVLARNIALRNKLSVHELNFSVQRTIDRIIFLRICEDRGIEAYGRLMALTNGPHIYARLHDLYRQAEEKYNSGIFDFQADGLTRTLTIDDKVLKPILAGLYYPQSPYEFSVLPADILGQVYEQFLGKVVRLTAAGRAKVEEKPEVKKAGGVYYTPTTIVDYIVQQTVGKLIEGKTPKQIAGGRKGAAAAPLRILDPACGSGSFLLGAYQYLLDYHRQWYEANDPGKHATGRQPALYQGAQGDWRLTTAEKKRILLNHIYGVDIDRQAVEVTKLSLLLKVLEGESDESIGQQLSFFHERALPNLDDNVKCGNSLIGPDYFAAQLMPDEEEMRRVNAFDWKAEFSEVMADGGFDCVIGNPPYGAFFGKEEKAYIKQRYSSYKYKYDSYIYFIERAISLTKKKGWVSFITPELWLRLENCVLLRRLVAEQAGFDTVRVFGENVFANAVVNTIVFSFQCGVPRRCLTVETSDDSWQISSESWQNNELLSIDYRLKPEISVLIDKIKQQSVPLADFGEVIQGLTPYDRYRGQDPELIKRRGYHFDHKKDDTCGKWLSGRNVSRYHQTWGGEWLSYGPWLAAPREERFFAGPRLLFREIPGKGKRIQATFVEETLYYGHSVTPFKMIADGKVSAKYLLSISNSVLLSWYGRLMLPNFGKDTFPKLNPQDIKQLPIHAINFNDPADVARHDKMVTLVERMLALHQKLTAATVPADKQLYQRQIEATDRQIDALVYELYGLSGEEIGVVEG